MHPKYCTKSFDSFKLCPSELLLFLQQERSIMNITMGGQRRQILVSQIRSEKAPIMKRLCNAGLVLNLKQFVLAVNDEEAVYFCWLLFSRVYFFPKLSLDKSTFQTR